MSEKLVYSDALKVYLEALGLEPELVRYPEGTLHGVFVVEGHEFDLLEVLADTTRLGLVVEVRIIKHGDKWVVAFDEGARKPTFMDLPRPSNACVVALLHPHKVEIEGRVPGHRLLFKLKPVGTLNLLRLTRLVSSYRNQIRIIPNGPDEFLVSINWL